MYGETATPRVAIPNTPSQCESTSPTHNELAMTDKGLFRQWFSKHIGTLVGGRDLRDLDNALIDMPPKVVELDV